MPPDTTRDDHDLLLIIAEGQKELKSDVRAMSDALKELKSSLDQTREQQRDTDNRLANLSNTVVRLQADQRDDRADINALKADTGRWKLYMKVALVLATPIYLVLLALLIEAVKKFFGL